MDLSARLSLEKALTVKEQYVVENGISHPHPIIIGVDQVASHNQQNLGKPGSFENARRQLQRFSGGNVTFYTGITVVHPEFGCKTKVESYSVTFRKLTDQQIQDYLTVEQPYDCAGSFKCEGLGILLFTAMQGRDINSLVGLPLMALNEILIDMGIDLLYESARSSE